MQDQAFYTVTDRTQRINQSGLKSLIEFFYEWEKKQPNKVFLRQPEGDHWKTYTWKEVGEQARRMAGALKALQLPQKSHIGLISKNCAHWIMSDLAIMMSGHISVPLFPTLTASQLTQVLTHSQTKVLFVGKLDDWRSIRDGIPQDLPVISFPPYASSAKVEEDHLLQWNDLVKKHEPLMENFIPKLSDLLTICYTSGTTGTPKGVMLSNYAFSTVYEATKQAARYDKETTYFSYLPLNHMAERIVVEMSAIVSGGKISFAESLETFVKNLQDTQPTHFLAVPRIWSKFQQGVLEKIPQKKLDTLLKIPILSGMIKRKIKKGLGLGNVRFVLTGAAPMPPSLFAWYHKLGLKLKEGYGMSENTAACTIMPDDNMKLGTVGKAQPGCEIKIDPETGEILMKAEWLMEGYYREPELTAQVFENGWLKTGDKGEIDKEGFLKITGRVKEIFKTSKGEYVSPFTLESGFGLNTLIDQTCVVGSNLPQPIALITLSPEGKKLGRPEIEAALTANLEEVNEKVFPYERIQKLVILAENWTTENGILTPTLKIKRNKIEEKYGVQFEKWFDAREKIIWVE